MGQGIYTALSMILAEELDAPFERVTWWLRRPMTSCTRTRCSVFR